MIIKTANESLRKYIDTVEIISNRYAESLNNKALFLYKLTILHVMIIPVSSVEVQTSGLCQKSGDNLSMLLFINETDPVDYIEFVIAHEFAHLLFKKMTDLLSVTGIVADYSTELTSIIRIAKDGTQYGRELEEQLADILAMYILKKNNVVFSDKLNAELGKTQVKRDFVINLTDVFGKNIFECNKIDDFSKAPGKEIYIVSNSFWYCAVTFALPQIIALYDKSMGRNSWKKLCDALDNNKFSHLDKELQKIEKVA